MGERIDVQTLSFDARMIGTISGESISVEVMHLLSAIRRKLV